VGKAGDISLTAGLNLVTELGSTLSANGMPCPAGKIDAKASKDVSIDGVMISDSGNSGAGGVNQRPGGGPITLDAGCNLTIVTGTITSRGRDPGGDLVQVKGGCAVVILGLVQSTGPGHVFPQNPPNHCGPLGGRPDKPADSTACVEIWSGGPLVVDSTLPNKGEVSADVGQSGGIGHSWIDLIAFKDVNIIGDTTGPFAVHANQFLNDSIGGIITVKSKTGSIFATGLAIQADATRQDMSAPAPGGKGGSVTIEANLNVDLDGATIFARGDFVAAGGYGDGGQVSARARNGTLSWQNGVGDVQPTGTGILLVTPAAIQGTITLQDCTAGAIDTTGTSFPVTAGAATTPSELGDSCPGDMPFIQPYVDFGTCSCGQDTGGDFCVKAAVQSVLDPASGRFPGNLGADVVVHTDLGDLIQPAIDAASDLNNDGYIIIGVAAKPAGALGGHTTQSISISQNFGLLPFALIACSVTLHDPTPLDGEPTAHVKSTAASPDLFIMDLHAAGSVGAYGWLVEGDGRTLRNVDAFDNGLAGIKFAGNGNTMHSGATENNAGHGTLVVGNGNLIEDTDAFGNGDDGIEVDGDNNQLLKNDAGDRNKGNGDDGIEVTGAGNLLSENDAFANTGDGIDAESTSAVNPNVLKKNHAGDRNKGNGENGIIVRGTGNGKPNPVEIDENTAKANGLAGIKVVGTGFELKKNQSGGSSDQDNGDCEYDVVAGNFNAKDNKANGATVTPNTDGAPFPTGCIGTP
jgi:hypothetical protein